MKQNLIWLCVAIAALILGTRFGPNEIRVVEKPVEVVKTKEVFVDRPVEVTKWVPKEVEKIVERTVEVPAKIPSEYVNALNYFKHVSSAKTVSNKESLRGIDSVAVTILLNEPMKSIVPEYEIRTKFEITLRRLGVPIDEKSRFSLIFDLETLPNENPIVVYSMSTNVSEMAFGFRNEEPTSIFHSVSTWREDFYGSVGRAKAREAFIATVESSAESFANDWLAMNPKK